MESKIDFPFVLNLIDVLIHKTEEKQEIPLDLLTDIKGILMYMEDVDKKRAETHKIFMENFDDGIYIKIKEDELKSLENCIKDLTKRNKELISIRKSLMRKYAVQKQISISTNLERNADYLAWEKAFLKITTIKKGDVRVLEL